jgi:hypothetical protein
MAPRVLEICAGGGGQATGLDPVMPEIPDEVGKGARARVLDFLVANVGRVIDSDQIRKAAGSSEWARRFRELRDEFGYPILSHKDRRELKLAIFVDGCFWRGRPRCYRLPSDTRQYWREKSCQIGSVIVAMRRSYARPAGRFSDFGNTLFVTKSHAVKHFRA